MKTLISMNKDLCNLNQETWCVQEYVSILEHYFTQFFPKAKIYAYYRQHTDLPFQSISVEQTASIESDETLKLISANRDFSITNTDSKDDIRFLLPYYAKKRPAALIIIQGKKKKLEEYETKARELYDFTKEHFSRLKHSKKILLNQEKDIQNRHFAELRKFLSTRKTISRKYIQSYILNPGEGNPALTDFANVYKLQKDVSIFCLCDLTCNADIRFEALTLIDAAITILSKTDIAFTKYLAILDAAFREKLSTAYLSIACILYNEKDKTLEIIGAGSCICLFYEHDSGTIKRIQFNDPLGVNKQSTIKPFHIQTNAGDVLLVCSDGIIENKKNSGNEYGIDFISSIFQKHTHLPVFEQAEIIEKNYLEILDSEEICDDCTIQMYKFE